MILRDAKQLFFKLRRENRIQVCEEHIIDDHPERAYTVEEVLLLVKSRGTFQDTTNSSYLGKRFYWRTKDVLENNVRLVIEFEEDEAGQMILVISAGARS